MTFTAKNKILTGFTVVVVILAVLSVIFYYSSIKYQEDTMWITHTREVSLKAEETQNLLTEAESGHRGYLLTGKPHYLASYIKGKTGLKNHIHQLKKLVIDNPIQDRRSDSLLNAAVIRFIYLEKTLDYFNNKKRSDSTFILLLDQGQESMKQFVRIITNLKSEENRLLKIRVQNTKNSIQYHNFTYVILILSIFLTLAAIWYFLLLHLRSQEKTQKTVKRNWQVLQSIMDNMPAMVYKKNMNGEFVQVNKKYSNYLNRPYHQLIGKKITDILPEETALKFLDREESVKTAKISHSFEDTFVQNKVKTSTLTTLFPLIDESDHVYAICGMIFDISDRILKEELLLYQSFMIQNASDAIIGSDLDFNITSWNKASELLYGFNAGHAIGKHVFTLLRSKDPQPENVGEFIKSSIEKDNEWRGEFLYWRADDKEIPISTSCSYIKDVNGNPIGILAVNRNIEKEKLQEESIKNLNHELEAFTYSVSHDLRAPLRSIDGYSRILIEDYADKLDEDGVKILNTVIRNAVRMGILIDDLLDFSKISRHELNKRDIDMNSLLQKVLIETEIPNTNPFVCFDIYDLPVLQGDPKMLILVWTNLLSNALKYSRNNFRPNVEIGCNTSTFEHTFYVKDNGVGFEMQYYNKLFSVFQRLHTVEEFEGTGVGLALISRIISKHGGKVWAESELNKGAKFYFSLPI